MPPDGPRESQIEPAVVHANDDVRLARDGQLEQLAEQAAEFAVFFEHVRYADDRVWGEIEGEFHPRGGHAGSAGAEKSRRQLRAQGLDIGRGR